MTKTRFLIALYAAFALAAVLLLQPHTPAASAGAPFTATPGDNGLSPMLKAVRSCDIS